MVKIELRPAAPCRVERYTVSWVDAWDCDNDEPVGCVWVVGTADEVTARHWVEGARNSTPPMPGAILVATDSCGNRRYDLE